MKALSVKQPWASMITRGVKNVENRSRRTTFRGTVLVQASLKMADYDFTEDQKAALKGWTVLYPDLFDNHQFGAIIGEVDIVGCELNYSSVWAEQMAFDVCPETGIHILRKGQPYVWNWLLDNAKHYDEPILNVKGQLGIWNYKLL